MIRTVEDFDRLILALDRAEWLTDDRFNTIESRIEHHETLTALMREAVSETHTLVKQVPPLDDARRWSGDAGAYEIGMGCRW